MDYQENDLPNASRANDGYSFIFQLTKDGYITYAER